LVYKNNINVQLRLIVLQGSYCMTDDDMIHLNKVKYLQLNLRIDIIQKTFKLPYIIPTIIVIVFSSSPGICASRSGNPRLRTR